MDVNFSDIEEILQPADPTELSGQFVEADDSLESTTCSGQCMAGTCRVVNN